MPSFSAQFSTSNRASIRSRLCLKLPAMPRMLLRSSSRLVVPIPHPPASPGSGVAMVTDEADVVLHILSKKERERTGSGCSPARGLCRLQEAGNGDGPVCGRSADFRTVRALRDLPEAGSGPEPDPWASSTRLRKPLGSGPPPRWIYLPEGARIRAKIYPVIKPRDNSFVFEVKTDPAIFLLPGPCRSSGEAREHSSAQSSTTSASGGAARAPLSRRRSRSSREPPGPPCSGCGGFDEALAMLAAAGGPRSPPSVSPAADRERADRDVARFPDDLREVEAFLRDVPARQLTEEEAQKAASPSRRAGTLVHRGMEDGRRDREGPWPGAASRRRPSILASCLHAYNEAAREFRTGRCRCGRRRG